MSDAKPNAKKPGLSKFAEVPSSSAPRREGEDSDEEYGRIVADREIQHPIIKKTLSKYGINNEIVKKLSVQNNDGADSDEEYGRPEKDPELIPIPDKLQHPIVPKTLSKYGIITAVQKPIIENPRGDSDDEYGAVDGEFLNKTS